MGCVFPCLRRNKQESTKKKAEQKRLIDEAEAEYAKCQEDLGKLNLDIQEMKGNQPIKKQDIVDREEIIRLQFLKFMENKLELSKNTQEINQKYLEEYIQNEEIFKKVKKEIAHIEDQIKSAQIKEKENFRLNSEYMAYQNNYEVLLKNYSDDKNKSMEILKGLDENYESIAYQYSRFYEEENYKLNQSQQNLNSSKAKLKDLKFKQEILQSFSFIDKKKSNSPDPKNLFVKI